MHAVNDNKVPPVVRNIPTPCSFQRLLLLEGEALTMLGDPLGEDVEAISGEITCGTSELHRAIDTLDGKAIAYIVTRIESRPAGKEYVIVAVAGTGLHKWSPMLVSYARRIGCKTMRAHTNNLAQARNFSRYGFQQIDMTFQADLHNG